MSLPTQTILWIIRLNFRVKVFESDFTSRLCWAYLLCRPWLSIAICTKIWLAPAAFLMTVCFDIINWHIPAFLSGDTLKMLEWSENFAQVILKHQLPLSTCVKFVISTSCFQNCAKTFDPGQYHSMCIPKLGSMYRNFLYHMEARLQHVYLACSDRSWQEIDV